MTLTNYLLLVIAAILLAKFFPSAAATIALIGLAASVAYGLYWIVAVHPGKRRQEKMQREQEAKDDKEYWEYQAQFDAIRARHDPKREWHEATVVPQAYKDEIRRLNAEHHEMLKRRNGISLGDDED